METQNGLMMGTTTALPNGFLSTSQEPSTNPSQASVVKKKTTSKKIKEKY
jgi:hypothetical protein